MTRLWTKARVRSVLEAICTLQLSSSSFGELDGMWIVAGGGGAFSSELSLWMDIASDAVSPGFG